MLMTRHAAALTALLLAACGPATPPADPPPAPTAAPSASAMPAPTAAPSASAAASAEPPEGPSPFFPAIVHGDGSLRFYPTKKGGIAINGFYMSRPILVDEGGAHVEPHIFDGLKGEIEPNAFGVNGLSGDWPRSGSISINLPGDRGGTDVNYTWNGATWVKAPVQPFAGWPRRSWAPTTRAGSSARRSGDRRAFST